MSGFFERFKAHLETRYPETARALDLNARLSPLLFCPEVVTLPRALAEEAKHIVQAFFALRNDKARSANLENLTPAIADPGNFSTLMSYDFHVDNQGQLRLIEINTNAAMSLMTELLYEVHGVENIFGGEFRREIIDCFEEEAQLAGFQSICGAVITDEKPEEQRAYLEFLMYQELFKRAGWTSSVVDTKGLVFENGALLTPSGEKIDLVYNRHTDFYFEGPDTATLRQAMLARAACISPHPHEYRLLADKERLLELSQPEALKDFSKEIREPIERSLIRTLDVKSFADPEELWANRKKMFFKTKHSFGGKAAYRGEKISRSVFAQILAGPYLAQEYVPAPELHLPGANEGFKFDLRFYVYKSDIQLACARLYKGQMTNSQTPGGGLAAIRWA